MFFINTYKRHIKEKHIIKLFETSYEIKKNFKVSKCTIPLLFPKQRLAVIFGEYKNNDKNTIEIENAGLKIFNIPVNECIFTTCGRLLYILKNTEK